MPFRWNPRDHFWLAVYFLKWILIAAPMAGMIGSAVALFLAALDRVTRTRWDHPWLLYLLPIAGAGIGWLYHRFGQSVEGGNNLIIQQIHTPGGGVPRRMAPLVLIGTLATHLCGGSAGREGTAVQMGGSLASAVCRAFKWRPSEMRTLLMIGIAAGFGAVFGTPLAGAIFAIEVLAIGRMSYGALIPCLIGAMVGDWTTTLWGIVHTPYHLTHFAASHGASGAPQVNMLLMSKVALAAIAFGMASVLFSLLAHGAARGFKWAVPSSIHRPAIGGAIIIALVFVLGTRDYLGLGVSTDPHAPGGVSILSCFNPGGATPWSWMWKMLFTLVTLSAGFKGGEVTPLFFIGAALGNTLAWLLDAPPDLFAALGFVAVFAGATNTPLACTIMAIELFGAEPGLLGSGFVIYAAVACFIAYLISGRTSIYTTDHLAALQNDTVGNLLTGPSR